MENQKTLNDKLAERGTKASVPVKPEEPETSILKPCNNNGLFAVIALLFIVSAAGWYMYFDVKGEKNQVITQLDGVSNEKEQVTNELKELIVQYEDMKSDNEEVNTKLEEEQARIEGLLTELEKVKKNNRWQIHKYKKELSTLRVIMKSYIYQIDSLNTMNINLRHENTSVTAENRRIANKNQKLETLTENLSSTVERASVLRAINLSAMGIKKKGKETNRMSKVEKVKACFTLAENAVATKGPQFIYLQIVNPAGEILSGAQNSVEFGEQVVQFSDKREIDYDNKDLEVCIFWAKTEVLSKGEYKVNIISNGYVIGTTAFYLK